MFQTRPLCTTPTPLNLKTIHSSLVQLPKLSIVSSTSSMDSKKPNKISEIVRLQQILKKWRKIANNTPNNNNKGSSCSSTISSSSTTSSSSSSSSSKGKKFLKKTLSFTDSSVAAVSTDVVPKGFLAVCVGREMKRFIIPTEYLSHRAFGILLREAEEEFGFQHEGVLRIPCEVHVFEKILKLVEEKKEVFFIHEMSFSDCSSEAEITQSLHPHNPMCRW